MSLLYNKLIESVKTAIYESLFDDIDDIVTTDNNNVSTIIDKLGGNYNYVDLGLPSGTLWCNKNLGAEDETDLGNYYQWGYAEPVKEGTRRLTYKDYTKFNPSRDNKTYTKYDNEKIHYQLDNSDDAAYQETGGFFRIPTPEQWKELLKYCRWEVEDMYDEKLNKDIKVYVITSKRRGNNNFIYLPMCRMIDDGFYSADFVDWNFYGFYWTSDSNSRLRYERVIGLDPHCRALGFMWGFDEHNSYYKHQPCIHDYPRWLGFQIRPVMNNN